MKIEIKIFFILIVFTLSVFIPLQTSSGQDILVKLARVLSYQKKYDESLKAYDEYLKQHPMDSSVYEEAADVALWNGNLELSEEYLGKAASSGGNKSSKLELRQAEVLSYDNKFKDALSKYNSVLAKEPDNVEALNGKARLLSWTQSYDEAVTTYDKSLSLKYSSDVERSKARTLGWAKKYRQAIDAYESAFEKSGSESIGLERDAKIAFWNGWTKTTIKKYRKLLELEPRNTEAMFDLAQTEGYERMWRQSHTDFSSILDIEPNHFRAKDSLERVDLMWKHPSIVPIFRWLEQRSDDRSAHVDRYTAGAQANVPVCQALSFFGGYQFDFFTFPNFNSIPRQQAIAGASLSATPHFWMNASVMPSVYTSDSRTSVLFNGQASVRPFDPIILTAFTERDDLFNQRIVFDKQLRKTNVGGKISADIHRRWKAFGDYAYSVINDGNNQNAFGIENLVYLLYSPKQLTADVRFDFQNWKFTTTDYWSPSNFWHVSFLLHFRHYLNKHDLYFGADNVYYGVKYRFQIDRQKCPFNGGTIEGFIDWNKHISSGAEFFGNYSTVYHDIGAIIVLKFIL